MLDDDILYEEYYLKGYRSLIFLRFFRFCGYFLIFAIFFTSVVHGFYSGNYKKEGIVLQVLLVATGAGFAWGMAHSALLLIAYLREFLMPAFLVYQRNLSELPFGNGYIIEKVRYISESRLEELKKALQPQKNIVQQSDFADKTVYVVVGKYSRRIWDIRAELP